jgi:hypothetical protein
VAQSVIAGIFLGALLPTENTSVVVASVEKSMVASLAASVNAPPAIWSTYLAPSAAVVLWPQSGP